LCGSVLRGRRYCDDERDRFREVVKHGSPVPLRSSRSANPRGRKQTHALGYSVIYARE
jgi:hypothetical protein